ncbi:MAG: hypothetical protein CL484_14705 [Acidobacteria bacterium]|nr:hypothetical protein [Acidobacteriota bacterium]
MNKSIDTLSESTEWPLRGETHGQVSPLWLLTRQPRLNELVAYLTDMRKVIDVDPDGGHVLSFSRARLGMARTEFAQMIRQGEARLHLFCKLLASCLFAKFEMQSVVIGEVPNTRKRFQYSQGIDPATLFSETDLALGTRLLDLLRCQSSEGWETPRLVANFVEYQPLLENDYAIHKMISRVKAEEEIWNKVCDEIFRLDELIQKDKQFRTLSPFIKDVFGVKVVVGTPDDARYLQAALEMSALKPHGGTDANMSETVWLRVLESKDYLGDSGKKRTGWEAIKSVVNWSGGVFELQIQPLANYFLERERLTSESHVAFKQNRENIRNGVISHYPLIGFYRDLLRWLFLEAKSCSPSFRSVQVVVND